LNWFYYALCDFDIEQDRYVSEISDSCKIGLTDRLRFGGFSRNDVSSIGRVISPFRLVGLTPAQVGFEELWKMAKCGKRIHATKEGACIAAKRISKVSMNVYRCRPCKGWHIGNTNDPARRALRIEELLNRHKRELTKRMGG
jgi:hypothetical protein